MSATEQLLVAAGGSDAAAVQTLIAAGANVNAKGVGGMTPLHTAAMTCSSDTVDGKTIVDLLIAAGATLNATNDAGRTALYCVVQNAFNKHARLLASGVDVYVADSEGHAVFDTEPLMCKIRTVKALVTAGANRSLGTAQPLQSGEVVLDDVVEWKQDGLEQSAWTVASMIALLLAIDAKLTSSTLTGTTVPY
jgi:ankyrin repeat protein